MTTTIATYVWSSLSCPNQSFEVSLARQRGSLSCSTLLFTSLARVHHTGLGGVVPALGAGARISSAPTHLAIFNKDEDFLLAWLWCCLSVCVIYISSPILILCSPILICPFSVQGPQPPHSSWHRPQTTWAVSSAPLAACTLTRAEHGKE